MKKLSYRPEIDGLRTIAVLSVIIYHAQIVIFGHEFFKGGFVGVDIFFVISGYLISRILLSELFEKGRISFLTFYERRARRILPILFTVFIASFPFAYKYLLPNQFIEYAQSILSATFFGSNIFFYFTNTQYGAEDSLLQPFLHTWSLGVEEQFYILFPIILLLAYKFAKNHLVTIFAALILISLQYADWQSAKNSQLNFFMLTSRLWELGFGSLLAFYELKYGRVKNELLNQTMPLLGLFLITHSIVFFNNQTPHPSLITLLPTAGTALIILYSLNKTDLVGKVLSWKPIVGIGLISYSMYLWHYPIFAFARISNIEGIHNIEKILLILSTIIISIISYYLIEKPFRNVGLISKKKLIITLSTLCILIISISSYFFLIPTTKEELKIDKLMRERSEYRYEICGQANEKCKDKKNILFIGDSMVMDALNAIISISPINYEFNTLGGCPPIKNTKLLDAHPQKEECILLNEKRFNQDLSKYDGIVIINRYGWFKPKDLEEYLKFLNDSQFKNVILFGDGVSYKKNFTDLLEKEEYDYIINNTDYGRPDSDFYDLQKKFNFQFISVKESIVDKLNMENLMVQVTPLVIDKHHLSLETGKLIGNDNSKKIKSFLSN